MNGLGTLAENVITPRLPSGERIRIHVSDQDVVRIIARGRGPGMKGVFTDVDTGVRYRVYGASCGIPTCYCDSIAHVVEDQP